MAAGSRQGIVKLNSQNVVRVLRKWAVVDFDERDLQIIVCGTCGLGIGKNKCLKRYRAHPDWFCEWVDLSVKRHGLESPQCTHEKIG